MTENGFALKHTNGYLCENKNVFSFKKELSLEIMFFESEAQVEKITKESVLFSRMFEEGTLKIVPIQMQMKEL